MDWHFTVGALVLLTMMLIGVPVFVSIGLGTLLIVVLSGNSQILPNLGQDAVEGINVFAFLAIPLYVLTGDIISRSGLARALLDLARSIVGSVRGGMSATVLLACGFFAAISGSNASDAAVFSRLAVPELERFGYPRPYSAALVASGGCTAILIPPSISYIILGYVTGLDVSDLFLATIIPGVLLIVIMIAVNLVHVARKGYDQEHQLAFSFRNMLARAWDAKVGLSMPVIILGGIYSGVFTPTEAAAIAVMVGLVHGVVTRKIDLATYYDSLRTCGVVCGVIAPVMVMSYFLGQTMTYFEIQKTVVDAFLFLTKDYYLVLLTMFVIVFVMGCFIDALPNTLILGPLLLPVAKSIGMNPIHFGIWFIFTMCIGFITPPYGFNLFVVSSVTGARFVDVVRNITPFLIAMIIANVLIALIPDLSLWILRFR